MADCGLRNVCLLGLGLAVGLGAGYCLWHSDDVKITEERKIDTVLVRVPEPIHDTLVRWKIVSIIEPDTSHTAEPYVSDSSIYIPISQKIYTDTNYTAWVSGYDTRLDSIVTYTKMNTVYVPVSVSDKRRWMVRVGLQGGFYVTPTGLQPGIGVGLSIMPPY